MPRMRFETHQVSAQLVFALEHADTIRRIIIDGGDLLLVEHKDGSLLLIYLIENTITDYAIRNILTENSAAGRYTLFFLWSDLLLPGNGQLYVPEDYHQALLTAYGDKIYGYEVYHQHAMFYPVFFDRIGHAPQRFIRHGPLIDFGTLHTSTVKTDDGTQPQTFYTAGFTQERQAPPAPEPPSPAILTKHYAVLEITANATLAEIKKAYHNRARQLHPDLNPKEDATAQMQELNQAYAALLQHLDPPDPENTD